MAVLQRVNNSITVTNALNFVTLLSIPNISIPVHIILFGTEYYNFGIKEESRGMPRKPSTSSHTTISISRYELVVINFVYAKHF